MIPVTKTFLPPISEYLKYSEKIWSSNQITNGGDLWKELNEKLKNYLNSVDFILNTNGTLPLQIALKVLALNGEVITSPFSYVASTSSIVWQNCTPVFVDIHPEYFTIDETKISEAITEKTTAILATHVFGNPCNVNAIGKIARDNKLKVIYDAAHCFGVKYNNSSLFNYGDVSTCSFHATKIFHTGEGGAMFCNDPEIFHKLFYSHNFGHNGSTDFYGVGINAKMSELQAAMGLAVLPYVEDLISKRKQICLGYDTYLDFSNLGKIQIREGTEWNFSYYPIVFQNEKDLLKTMKILSGQDIFARRYFYPSLNTLHYVSSLKMPISESIAERILCLPVYHNLAIQEVKRICFLVNKSFYTA